MTVPARLRPAPSVISATPAASASFRNATGRCSRACRWACTFMPIQRLSMLAAVQATPCLATAGNASPTGPLDGRSRAIVTSSSSTASGAAPAGVARRRVSPMTMPDSTCTSPALTYEPPTSNASRSDGSPSITSISSAVKPKLPRKRVPSLLLPGKVQPFFRLSIICWFAASAICASRSFCFCWRDMV